MRSLTNKLDLVDILHANVVLLKLTFEELVNQAH